MLIQLGGKMVAGNREEMGESEEVERGKVDRGELRGWRCVVALKVEDRRLKRSCSVAGGIERLR